MYVMGFTSPSMGDGSSTGPMVMWMENTETGAVVVVISFIYKRIYLGGTPEINCRKGKDKEQERTLQYTRTILNINNEFQIDDASLLSLRYNLNYI